MTEISLKNEQLQFEGLKKLSADVAEQCNKLQVTDETTKAIAMQNLSKALEVTKQIEAIRVKLKDPYLSAGKQIDSLAKSLSSPIVTSIDEGKKKILAYDRIQQEKALIEQNRILAIKNTIAKYSNDAIAEMDKCKTFEELKDARNRLIVNAPMDKWGEFTKDFETVRYTLNEYSKSIKTKLLTPQEADPEETTAIKEAIVADTVNIGVAEIVEAQAPQLTGKRKTWAFEVVDFNQIPREWLVLNDDIVKKFISENKEEWDREVIIKGIKYFQKESLVIR